MRAVKHFIDLDQIAAKELRAIIDNAKKLKKLDQEKASKLLPLKNLAMIFEKTSTRTRVSFEAGINQLGGSAIVMNKSDMQLGKGEIVSDTAKVLSRLVDMVMIRCKNHRLLTEMAANSTIPIINGLSDYSHPCQIIASILAIEESLGNIKGKKLAWFGDANNVLNSYIHAALAFDYQLDIAVPEGFDFCDEEITKAQGKGAKINLYHDAKLAAKDADVLITDTWISMGQLSEEDEKAKDEKLKILQPYQVNQDLMNLAKDSAIFTHCLPAYREFEVTGEVIDSDKSIVFDEAENRLHAQKAIMLWLHDVAL
ncbi:MAG: ornithine carbamoyltransferase [Proteobacteria bacterium]|nr:ornithine carbamoyltransferase [Pseudomonadota bacterium]